MRSPHPIFDKIVGPYMELVAEALAPRWPTKEEADIWHRAS